MAGAAKFDVEEAARLHEQDPKENSYARLSERYSVTRQAVADRVKKYRERQNIEVVRQKPWPWPVRNIHTQGSVLYESVLALRKMYDGEKLTNQETTRARGLLTFSAKMDVVITYDPERGFMWTSRRPEDHDAMFVVR